MSIRQVNISNNISTSSYVNPSKVPLSSPHSIEAKLVPDKIAKYTTANLQAYSNISFKASLPQHLGQGARYLGDGQTKFTLTAPDAEKVLLTIYSGDIDDEDDVSIQRVFLDKNNDTFEAIVDETLPGDKYSYSVMKKDGSFVEVYDPRADYLPYDVDGYQPSSGLAEIIDHSSFEWSDEEWIAKRSSSNTNHVGWGIPNNTVVESIHVGLLGGFKEAKKEIDKINEIGIANAVRVMPVGEFYGDKNWGYDEVAKFAVENSYGRPEDFKEFVDYAHEKGISVILDVVPNHFGPYGSVVHELMPTFDENGEETPWGKKLEFRGDSGKYMRSYMTDMLMNWAVNYHVDGFRFDATHFMNSDHAVQEMIRDLRSHKETKDLILYPEDMRIARTMANSNLEKNVSGKNWGFSAMTTFDFYKSLLANVTKTKKHDFSPNLAQLEHVFKNVIEKSHEEIMQGDMAADESYRRKCKENLSLPGQNADNFIINISNHDEIGNEAGGKRNLVNILSSELKMIDRFGGDWKKAQYFTFEMIKNYVKKGNVLSEATQKSMGCHNPISQSKFDYEFHKAYETNKLILGAMMVHPSPKEFFMGDERGELAPLKFFTDSPDATHYKNLADEKGYKPDKTAFAESMMNQKNYNASWINEGMQNFSKDFAELLKSHHAFRTAELNKIRTFAHTSSDILEVKRFDDYNNEIIAVINLSSTPKTKFNLITPSTKKLRELVNSNDSRYNGNGQYNNKWKESISSDDVIIPPNGIVVFETVK